MIEVLQWICIIIGIIIIIALVIFAYCCFVISSKTDKELEKEIKEYESKRFQKNNKKQTI